MEGPLLELRPLLLCDVRIFQLRDALVLRGFLRQGLEAHLVDPVVPSHAAKLAGPSACNGLGSPLVVAAGRGRGLGMDEDRAPPSRVDGDGHRLRRLLLFLLLSLPFPLLLWPPPHRHLLALVLLVRSEALKANGAGGGHVRGEDGEGRDRRGLPVSGPERPLVVGVRDDLFEPLLRLIPLARAAALGEDSLHELAQRGRPSLAADRGLGLRRRRSELVAAGRSAARGGRDGRQDVARDGTGILLLSLLVRGGRGRGRGVRTLAPVAVRRVVVILTVVRLLLLRRRLAV
mmetsp:Transcript_35306/g.76643  ORF Transcript_35306/g.76643 Transcript_35306/m.76643 type:complete len:289 (+) Transcript_35306:837-1703(+)